MHIDLFLFDIAGTTVRDDGWVVGAFKDAAAAYGLSPETEWLRTRMGIHKEVVFRELLAEHGVSVVTPEALVRRFDDSIERLIDRTGVHPLPGVRKVIEQLIAAGVRVGFTTGFGRTTALRVVGAAGFPTEIVVGSDEVPAGRPAPHLIEEGMRRAGVTDASRVAVAGDTPSDLEAGTNARCGFVVGVGHGSHSLDELARAPHTHLMADFGGLIDVLRAPAGVA